ncbi:MAG: phosphoenolpyruvate--protein phosphotransferase [Deltaproteobacteria bacterium]|nr:phosphoenolpyruvate--protein phosphotransferase [Deltaproteobacteria bacterium]
MTDINRNQHSPGCIFSGIGASPGIAIGRAFLLDRAKLKPRREKIASDQVEAEIERFRAAVASARKELEEIKNRTLQDNGREGSIQKHNYIFDVHLLMMEDKMLIDDTITLIKEKKINAEWALNLNSEKIIDFFRQMQDSYLRERQSDVTHVSEQILRHLTKSDFDSIDKITRGVIIVAHDLSPADTLQLDPGKVKAFVTDLGGRTSHTAIVARSLEIPAVVGTENATEKINGGDRLIVDGIEGRILVNPSREQLTAYIEKRQQYNTFQAQLILNRDLPAETTDGFRISLAGNIETPEETESVVSHGAVNIGLYRTEFLFLNRQSLPSEEEHYLTYRKVVESLPPESMTTIRTFDLGSDKIADAGGLHEDSINPALGLRGIRLCLNRREIFVTQLRGIFRASPYGKLKILLPMISGLAELRQALEVIEETREELRREGVDFDPEVPVGVMIEVPSAAVISDHLAREVDFFSIGTNDLIQYTLALDRSNEHVSYLYEPLHPAILRLLNQVISNARVADVPVSICGEMAGEPLYTLVLLGLGLDKLSMNAISIPHIKQIIRQSTFVEARQMLEECLKMKTATEIEAFITREMNRRFPDTFLMKI